MGTRFARGPSSGPKVPAWQRAGFLHLSSLDLWLTIYQCALKSGSASCSSSASGSVKARSGVVGDKVVVEYFGNEERRSGTTRRSSGSPQYYVTVVPRPAPVSLYIFDFPKQGR
jgi:hypothetical protein